ncbi:MAG: molybdate ABC transporter substrate-binding protein [Allopontixanthobacter sediminis]
MTLPARLLAILALLLAACSDNQAAPTGPVILGPSSLQEALEEVADGWAAKGHSRPQLSFAGSPATARQVSAGAPADVILLADELWMDRLEIENLLAAGTRRALLGNTLVLVAPAGSNTVVADDLANLPALLGNDRLAMADPDTVPAGRYGRMALESMGLWDKLARKVAPAENVRAALALVEAGEAPFGVVYSTDLAASDKVRMAAAIPEGSQPPIRYPVAMLASSSHPDASGFLAFIASAEAEVIFARYGFTRLAER